MFIIYYDFETSQQKQQQNTKAEVIEISSDNEHKEATTPKPYEVASNVLIPPTSFADDDNTPVAMVPYIPVSQSICYDCTGNEEFDDCVKCGETTLIFRERKKTYCDLFFLFFRGKVALQGVGGRTTIYNEEVVEGGDGEATENNESGENGEVRENEEERENVPYSGCPVDQFINYILAFWKAHNAQSLFMLIMWEASMDNSYMLGYLLSQAQMLFIP